MGWSEKQGAEKFSHTACTGQSSWLNGPCVHLILAPGSNITSQSSKPQSYLYTKDESKCCISEPSASSKLKFPPSGGAETLAPISGTSLILRASLFSRAKLEQDQQIK